MHRILIVSELKLVWTGKVLRRRGLTVETAADFKTAFHNLRTSAFDAVIINLAGRTDGIDFIKRIRARRQLRDIPILVTAEWGTGYGSLALSLGANAYEPTPCDAANLIAAVKRLLKPQLAVAK